MDYSQLSADIVPDVMRLVGIINNPEIAPETRQLNQEILFREVGQAVYAQIYDMNAFDFEIEHTTGPGIDERYYGLAKVASDSVSAGNLGLLEYVSNYIQNVTAKAQHDAMSIATQSGKHPTVIRTVTNPKACQWCKSLEGTFPDPSPDVFRRHGSCDCTIVTQGFRSRNGELKNYVKPKNR